MKKVTVLLMVNSEKIESEQYLNEWLLQDYDNYEIKIITTINKGSSRALRKAERLYKYVEVIYQEILNPFEVIDELQSDYTLFVNCDDYYPINYISLMVSSIHDESICLSQTGVLFPENRNQLLEKSVGFEFVSASNNRREFLTKYAGFFGMYFLGNKLIKTSVLQKKYKETKSILKYAEYENNMYAYHFLVSMLILLQCEIIAINDEAIAVINWSSYDGIIQKNLNTYLQASKNIEKVIDYIDAYCSEKEESIFEIIKTNFINRYWWRTSWIFDNKRKEDMFAELKDKFVYMDSTYKNDFENSACNIKNLKLSEEFFAPKESVCIDTAKKINIYVSMHKPSYVPDNKYLLPIQVGTALAEERFEEVIHDDEGDNISEKNKRYCELTAQYWAWKNDLDADYYGFWHYRRYFCFNQNKIADRWANVAVDRINEKNLIDLKITEEEIELATDLYDIIIPEEWVCDEGQGEMTVYQHWCKHFYPEDMQMLIDVIHEKYPEYDKALMNLLFSTKAPFCNLFIMKKELFYEYNEFCFGVLGEVEKRVNHENYNVERYRTMGHLAERLVGVFVKYVEANRPSVSVLRVPTVLIKDTRPKAKINPIKTDRENVVICLACDNSFVQYTAVLLESIKNNSNSNYFYDIVLMHKDISEINQKKLESIVENRDNFSLRFADVSKNFEKYMNLHVDRHLSLETYFRFIIPEIMPDYDKVLYLDCDMVANDDVAELFFTNLEGYAIGATRDLDFIASYQEPSRREMYEEKIVKYLNIDSIENYFQAGVMLFDLKKISKMYSVKDFFEQATIRNWYYHDQDVLNSLFNNNVYYLDTRWNVLTMLEPNSERQKLFKDFLFARYFENYSKARKNIGLIHFAGVPKPWFNMECDLSMYFWKYARNTPYYEELLNTLNAGYMLPYGKVVFVEDYQSNQNLGCALFDIVNSNNPWAESYLLIDFVFLSEHERSEVVNGTLYIAASILPDANNQTFVRINKFEFDDKDFDYVLKDNIKYKIIDNRTIRIFACQTAKYEGFSWRIREIQSREIEKPNIVVKNNGFIDKEKMYVI